MLLRWRGWAAPIRSNHPVLRGLSLAALWIIVLSAIYQYVSYGMYPSALTLGAAHPISLAL
jgi:hypothetical protein